MSSWDKESTYVTFAAEAAAVLQGENQPMLLMATLACLGKTHFANYFWVGFYCLLNDELVVGPYQGSLGCLHIALGRGVCGTAAAQRRTLIVPDVHQFPGHIACDAASRSEIVVPIQNGQGQLLGVFDVDSTELAAFDETDARWLERIMARHFAECSGLIQTL